MKNSRIVTAVILLTGAGLMALGLTRGELGVYFVADEKISLGTDRAFIDITDETITLLGKEVIVE